MSKYTAISDQLFELPGGHTVDRRLLEQGVKKICHYVQHVAFAMKDGRQLVALIFPNRQLFSKPEYEKSPEEGCFCPRNLKELGKCLSGCMHTLNVTMKPGLEKIHAAVIVNVELRVEEGTLTPSLEVVDEVVVRKYVDHLENLFGGRIPVTEEAFNIKLGN